MSSECHGPAVDRDAGYLYCPRGPYEPEDGDWERYCQECQDGRDRLADWALDARADLVAGRT